MNTRKHRNAGFSLVLAGALMGLAACSDSTDTAEAKVEPVDSTTMADKAKETVKEVSQEVDKTIAKAANWREKLTLPAQMQFEDGKTYYWDMTTNKGKMSFELFHKTAPMHVTSTAFLTEQGFYDSLIFHRVIPGFMAQGGDPTGTGRGGPGYNYEGEFAPGVSHDKPGMLSMANAGPGTDGSQFFITFVPTPFLDGKHTIFGVITSGQEVLAKLQAGGSSSGKTSERLEIIQAKIRVE